MNSENKYACFICGQDAKEGSCLPYPTLDSPDRWLCHPHSMQFWSTHVAQMREKRQDDINTKGFSYINVSE